MQYVFLQKLCAIVIAVYEIVFKSCPVFERHIKHVAIGKTNMIISIVHDAIVYVSVTLYALFFRRQIVLVHKLAFWRDLVHREFRGGDEFLL